MFLSDERGFDVPSDIRHSQILAWPTRYLSGNKRDSFPTKVPLPFWLHAKRTLLGWHLLGDAQKYEGCP
jgi:hypothetical protein